MSDRDKCVANYLTANYGPETNLDMGLISGGLHKYGMFKYGYHNRNISKFQC